MVSAVFVVASAGPVSAISPFNELPNFWFDAGVFAVSAVFVAPSVSAVSFGYMAHFYFLGAGKHKMFVICTSSGHPTRAYKGSLMQAWAGGEKALRAQGEEASEDKYRSSNMREASGYYLD